MLHFFFQLTGDWFTALTLYNLFNDFFYHGIAFAIFMAVGALIRLLRRRAVVASVGRAPSFVTTDFPDGAYGRITGRVWCDRPLIAPISGRPCVFFRLTVESPGLDTVHYEGREVWTQEDAAVFHVEDACGRAEVRGLTAEYILEDAHGPAVRGVDLLACYPEAVGFLASRKLPTLEGQRITETALPLGEEVTVAGVAYGSDNLVLEAGDNEHPLRVTNDAGAWREAPWRQNEQTWLKSAFSRQF